MTPDHPTAFGVSTLYQPPSSCRFLPLALVKTMSFFTNARNVAVSGHNVTMTVCSGSQAADRGFDILCQNATPAALYGSNSYDTAKDPGCLHGTRLGIQDHIFKWLNSPEGEIAMWMYGPAGIGKTAIAHTISKLCAERGQLSSAFFFFRSDEGRNSTKHLVPTLAFEMLQQMPHTRDVVCIPTANNPLIFCAPLERQIKTIILPALFTLFPSTQATSGPYNSMLLIIDGLDECMDIGMQQLIVRLFISLLAATTTATRHKILIVSRPESHIVSTFSRVEIARHVHHLCLDKWNSIADISIFLRAELEEIKRTHPLKSYLGPRWPSDDALRKLLHKSFESFAYASSAIRYISSHDRHPDTSLSSLLSLSPDCAYEAHAELDLLYRHILESLDEMTRHIVLKILSLHSCTPFLSIQVIASILHEETSVVELAVVKMSSVIRLGRPLHQHSDYVGFSYYHTSFRDFLLDEKRSAGLYLYSSKARATTVAAAIISRMWAPPLVDRDYSVLTSIESLLSRFDTLAVDMQTHILRAFIASKFPIELAFRNEPLVQQFFI
ncbi:hypothetical protein D9619_012659 [Psilocybe cf. subviscida]|uniref:Nephrocystin 3-like N-terminal domain-containing protein n=1 Tax=Psilocybe cf. subviscida TaxID=2480587 RepID=A0A8H5B6U3_9AGAR|nr:hypothetical protein D9619_012659 [Psilocybe cf. subviscida]